ncbi:MAG: hypothetical protein IKV47_04135 [Oscillospiraceae bacterium]|nr:hypothetical protein [Oscillospiraceae bacterium]
MKYKECFMLAAIWCLCTNALDAKDLLACEFKPCERSATGILGTRKISIPAMYKRFTDAHNYKTMHPVFRKWVEDNKNYYRYFSSREESFLYRNNEDGIEIYERGGKIFLGRTRFFGDDEAWTYQKEPAINPATARPWIELSAAEMRTAKRGAGRSMTEEEQQYLDDVLAILNENFHYFYGMKLVDLSREENVDRAQLMGKFIPVKVLLFGPDAEMFDMSQYSPQQQTLYQWLGHPIYTYERLIDPTRAMGIGSDCAGRGVSSPVLRSGYQTILAYFNQVSPDEVNLSLLARSDQLGTIPVSLNHMVKQMERLFAQKGANVHSQGANKTPLARALYMVYHKTSGYVSELVQHDYVTKCRNRDGFEDGVERLSDVVPIKGLKTARSSNRKGNRASSRTREKKNPNRSKR